MISGRVKGDCDEDLLGPDTRYDDNGDSTSQSDEALFNEYTNYDELEEEEIPEMELLRQMDMINPPMQIVKKLFRDVSGISIGKDSIMNMDQISELKKTGFIVIDNALPTVDAVALRKRALEMFNAGSMLDASKYRADSDPDRDGNARSDRIAWLKPHRPPLGLSEMSSVRSFFERLYGELSQIMVLHDVPFSTKSGSTEEDLTEALQYVEFQLAVYHAEEGDVHRPAHYERHRDAFITDVKEHDDEQRRITAILYANNVDGESSDSLHGGHLRIYLPRQGKAEPDREYIDVEPKAGRCVVFFSGVCDHAVLETTKGHRVALTMWAR